MNRKGLDDTISMVVTIVVLIVAVLIVSFILTTRTDALAVFGLENTQSNATSFLGG